jgi:hypothetical protein
VDQTCFSTGGLAAVGGLLTAMAAGLATLFGALIKFQADQNQYQRRLINELLKVGEAQNEVAKELVEAKTTPRRPRQRSP